MLLINIPSLVEDTNHPQIIVDKSQCLTCVIFLLERDSSAYRQHWLTTCIHPFSFFLFSCPGLRTYWSTSAVRGYWKAWPAEKKRCATKDINRLHFVSARSLSLCSFSHFYSLVTQLNAILPLCFSHCMDPSTSLSLSLSILGFTVSIPEGRSIDCNSLSMKSPLCYWRKEMSFNRTDNSLLLFFLIAPSLPFYKYNLLLPLFCARCEEDDREAVWGSSQRPRLEACLMISWERYWGTITPQAL